MRQGLVEWALLTGFLVLTVAGAIALFGEEIRAAIGVGPPASSAGAPAARSARR